jgi:ribose 5-phosphate isomerase RpiB
MIIALGSDHGAFELKNIIVEQLKQNGIKTNDTDKNRADTSDYSD